MVFLAESSRIYLWNTPLTLVDKNLNGIFFGGLLTVFADFVASCAAEVLHKPYSLLLEENLRVFAAHLVFIFLVV